MKNKMVKSIAYAYPTSKNAELLGFPKEGCWYVSQTLYNIEGSGQFSTFPAHNGEGYATPDDPDLISFFKECEGDICKHFLKNGNFAALRAITGTRA